MTKNIKHFFLIVVGEYLCFLTVYKGQCLVEQSCASAICRSLVQIVNFLEPHNMIILETAVLNFWC